MNGLRAVPAVVLALGLAAWVAATVPDAGTVAWFQGLGDLPGGEHASVALDVSGDGRVVVGYSSSAAGDQAFRWAGGAMIGLAGFSDQGRTYTTAHAVSPDGSVVAGGGIDGGRGRALVWRDGAVAVLADPPGGVDFSDAWDVSGDGTIVAGEVRLGGGRRAAVWRRGEPALLGAAPDGSAPRVAAAVSADGSTVAGVAGLAGAERGFRLAAGVTELLPSPEGGGPGSTTVRGLSADGSIAVGTAPTIWGREAIRWRGGEALGLGGLSDEHEPFSGARGVSGDGSVVVGSSEGPAGGEAFVWDERSGMRPLRDVLVREHGLDLAGWTLQEATAVSEDGRTIVGFGINPDGRTEAWIARLPPPGEAGAGNAASAPRRRDDFGSAMDVSGRFFAVTRPARGAIDLFDLDAPGEPRLLASAGGRGAEAGRFRRPAGVVLDLPRRRLIAGDAETLRLQEFALGDELLAGPAAAGEPPLPARFLRAVSTAGMLATLRPEDRPPPTVPGALAVDAEGGVYMIDVANQAVIALDQRLAPRVAIAGAEGEPFDPVDLAIEAGGERRLLVLDGDAARVAVFDRSGRALGGFALPAFADLGRPRGIAADEDGTVWVVGDAARVAHLDAEGRLIRAFGRPGLGPVEFHRPRAVRLDERGRVVVLDWGNHRAMLLSREGAQLGAFGGGRYAHPARVTGGGDLAAGSESPAFEAGAGTPASAGGLAAPVDATGSVPPAAAEVATAGGTFIVQLVPGPGELPLNELFEISVRVLERAGREPVSAGIELAVDAEMPAHRHGMTTRTRVRREPDGSFSVRGLLLHMPGAWRLTFDVTRGGVTERAEVEAVAGSVRAEFDDGEVRRILQLSPLGPPPADSNRIADDPRAVRLGQILFFDPRLSLDGATSCATCHDPARGFADGRTLPAGAERHGRHTPSLWNVAYNRWYFWDGRADSLWAQALEPLERASELGGGRLRVAHWIDRDQALRSACAEVFGPPPDLGAARRLDAGGPLSDDPAEVAAWEALPAADRAAVDEVFVHAGKAIGAYERLLVSRRAPFDRFVEGLRRGDEAAMRTALTPAARRGLRLFVGRAGCRLCHGGPNFTDGEFHDTGVPSRAPGSPRDAGRAAGIRLLRASPFNATGEWSDDPAGPAAQRLEFLADRPETRGRWKTPTLRNVARTAPYMHQGQLRTLEQVLAHYSTLRGAAFADGHRETVLRPLDLSEGEIADLVAFLESLTDEQIDPALMRPPADGE